jgi:hypothetical protein
MAPPLSLVTWRDEIKTGLGAKSTSVMKPITDWQHQNNSCGPG